MNIKKPKATGVKKVIKKPSKKVAIAKGKKVTLKKLSAMRKKPGGSNVGKYANTPSKDFAGPAAGGPPGSGPIATKAEGRSFLKLAHNFPNPSGGKRKVYKKYPSLKPKSQSKRSK